MATAYGFVETNGFVGAAEANDALNKAADVSFAHRADIGGGYVTTVCTGDVGAVRSAVAAGCEAARGVGELYASHVIPNLHRQVIDRIIGTQKAGDLDPEKRALGLVECLGYTLMIEAADSGVKAANVDIVDACWTGRGYAAVVFRGDVAACRAAVDAGQAGAGRIGRVIGSTVIPAPHVALFDFLTLGPGYAAKTENPIGNALGFEETRGYLAMVEAADAMIKAARVSPIGWQKVGAALVTFVVEGDVAACKAAVDAGEAAARRVGEHVSSHVIPRPHEAMAPFNDAGNQAPKRKPAGGQNKK